MGEIAAPFPHRFEQAAPTDVLICAPYRPAGRSAAQNLFVGDDPTRLIRTVAWLGLSRGPAVSDSLRSHCTMTGGIKLSDLKESPCDIVLPDRGATCLSQSSVIYDEGNDRLTIVPMRIAVSPYQPPTRR